MRVIGICDSSWFHDGHALIIFLFQVHTYAVLIAHTNSSLNSILYGLTNVEFRRGYARMLGLEKWLIARRARMGDENSVTATQVSAITEELKASQGGAKTAADTTTAAP